MASSYGRRSVLKGLGAVGALGVIPQVTGKPVEGRYLVDVGDEISDVDRLSLSDAGLDVVHELEHVGYFVVEGDESAVDSIGYNYIPDLEIRAEFDNQLPELGSGDLGELDGSVEPQQPSGHPGDVRAYNWDVETLNLHEAHQINTGVDSNGDPVRIGIIDDGVYPDHPGLNVVDGVDLTGDESSPFHPNVLHYHGTHVAGIAGGGEPAPDFSGAAPSDLEPSQQGDIETTDLNDPQLDSEALADLLLGEQEGIDIVDGSVQFTGANQAGGSFQGGAEIVGIDEGIILGSGNINDVSGPNDGSSTGTSNGTPGDADLDDELESGSTNDAAVLEFDFTVDESVENVFLRYVFGSDEYNEFVGSGFNDVFAFFVNGENAAAVPDPNNPGETIPAAINNINHGYEPNGEQPTNPDLYVNNDPFDGNDVVHNPRDFDDAPFNTEMDGFTVPLDIEGAIDPDGTNTLKVAIGDVGDSIYDSWVLLEAGSFSTEPPEQEPEPDPEPEPDGMFTGVAPDAELVSLRYFSFRTGMFGDFAAAVNEAVNLDCDVINTSIGFVTDQNMDRTYWLEYIQQFIHELTLACDANGIVWCGSAGNSANNANSLVPSSAKEERILSISATGPTGIVKPDGEGGAIYNDPLEPTDVPAYYTTHGNEYVDVSAPGGDWTLYFTPPNPDENQAAYLAAIREFVAPDGVLSALPPDVIGASLLLNAPLPRYAVAFNANIQTSATPGANQYDLYYAVSDEGSITPFINPDDTAGLTFATSFSAPDHMTGWLQGTSMASPQVTGVAALLSAQNPDWTPHQIRRVIRATARDVGKTTYHGHGMVNPVSALAVDDPMDVRDGVGQPGERDDNGRNEVGEGYNPRDSSGTRGAGRGDDEDDDGHRGSGRGDGGGRN